MRTRPAPKGGTRIAEDVTDLGAHERKLRTGGYRPTACERCGSAMHIHDERPRLLVGHPAKSTQVARFRCANRDACGAVVQVIPAFVARCLWRNWETVEAAIAPTTPRTDAPATPRTDAPAAPRTAVPVVPERTCRRWRARLLSSAAAVIAALAPARSSLGWVGRVIETVGLGGCRAEVVSVYRTQATPLPSRGLSYAGPAAVLHRVAPGLRLM